MTLDMTAQEDDILARLRTGMAPVKVIDTEVPDIFDDTPVGDGVFKPYIATIWGGPILNQRDRGIVGVRNDLMKTYVVIRVVTPDADTNRSLYRKLMNLMVGYRPINSGEMLNVAGMAYTNGNATTKPTRYFREVNFEYATNTTLEG